MPESIVSGSQQNVNRCPYCGTTLRCVESNKERPPRSHRYQCISPVCGKSWEIVEIVSPN
jgi:uncharacterized protein with PIN domain